MSILGIHHVTAITARIEENLAFYTGVLGLRLVKKTVNQDDVSAYHLFYADAVASPGTDMTFFDWPRSDRNRAGYATVALTTMRIPGSSLEAWKERLSVAGVPVEADTDGAGRARLVFQDFEGQRLAFVDDTGMRGEGVPWTEVVPVEMATRGILGVDLESARPDSTRRVMTELLGYEDIDGTRFALTGETASEVNVIEPTTSRIGSPGAGGVHHVAFRVKDDESLLAMKDRIEAFGIHTSGYVDRFYFHSLYFREPGGVLFELATDGPGMASDESADHLGESLSLPPFLESRRTEIVAGLKPLD